MGANGSKVPAVEEVFKPRHNKKLDSFRWREWLWYFVLSHGAIMEK